MRSDAEYSHADTSLAALPAADFGQRFHYNLHQLWRQSGCELVVEIGPLSVKNLVGTAPVEGRTYSKCNSEELVRHLITFAIAQQKKFTPSQRVLFNLTPFMSPSIFWCAPTDDPTLSTGLDPYAAAMVSRILTNLVAETHHLYVTVSIL